MLKQFFKDSVIYGLGAILARGVSLLLLPFYTRVLSPTDYGITDILGVFAGVIYVTIALEISSALFRYYADAQTLAEKVAYASTALWFTVVVYTVFVVGGILLSPLLAALLLDSSDRATIVKVALFSMWGYGTFNLTTILLRCELQSAKYAITNLTITTTSILMTIFLVLVLRLGVVGVVAGGLVGNAVGAGLSFYLTRHTYHPVFDWRKLGEMLKFSIPLVPSSVGVIVALYIDRIAIKQVMTLADVGLFGVGYRLASVVMLLMSGFQTALAPLIYTRYRQPETPGEIARIFRYFVALCLLVFLGLSLFAREILLIVTTPAYYAAGAVVPMLVLSIVLSRMYDFAPGLFIAKRTGVVALINLASAGLNTLLNFSLIPHLGIVGAALSTCLSAAATSGVYMILSQKLYYVPHNWKRLGLAALLAVGIVAVTTQMQVDLWLGVSIKFFLGLTAALSFIGLGLVELGDLRRACSIVKARVMLFFLAVY